MSEKPILNKGLDALLGDVEQPNTNIVKNIPTNKINRTAITIPRPGMEYSVQYATITA